MSMETLFTQKKVCSQCNEPRLLKYFDTHYHNGRWRFRSYCMFCRRKSVVATRDKDNHRRLGKEQHRKKQYGLSQAEFEVMLVEQDFKCAACKITIDTSACVDHDHCTGDIRGLLCNRCNVIIGFANDDVDVLQGIMKYLKGV